MNEPDRLYIDKDDRKLYDALEKEFGRRSNRERFLLAMAYGVKSGLCQPIAAREEYFLAKDFRPEDRAQMRALALSGGAGQEVLLNEGLVFQIAEEYAHAGIMLLSTRIETTGHGSFDKLFEKDLLDLFKEYAAGPDHVEASDEQEWARHSTDQVNVDG